MCIGQSFSNTYFFCLVILMSSISHAQVSTCSLHRHWLQLRALPFCLTSHSVAKKYGVAWRKIVWLPCTLVLNGLQAIHMLLLHCRRMESLYSSGIYIFSHRTIIPTDLVHAQLNFPSPYVAYSKGHLLSGHDAGGG